MVKYLNFHNSSFVLPIVCVPILMLLLISLGFILKNSFFLPFLQLATLTDPSERKLKVWTPLTQKEV
jgi:hypothetical protein